MSVSPSQGSHFFQNITSFMIGYFTVKELRKEDTLDWEWLLSQTPAAQQRWTKLFHFTNPLVIKINGHKSKGIILKPEEKHGRAKKSI
jgi:hypothetical protein